MNRSARPKSLLGQQFIRFATVGAVATFVHYSVLIALKELLDLNAVLGTFCGAISGSVVSYVLNRRFTFTTRPAFGRGLAMFVFFMMVGAGLNALIMALLTGFGAHYLVAQVVATIVVLFWNFLAARYFVFREPPAA